MTAENLPVVDLRLAVVRGGRYDRAMLRRLALACLVLAALPRGASANGRPPATSSIVFRPGDEADVIAGMTFGLLISRDAGATWAWVCEDAVGYSGMYDPRYVVTPGGSLFATTFNGFQVERDSCTFNPTGNQAFASTATIGPPGTSQRVYYGAARAAAQGVAADFNIYQSSDAEGQAFTATAGQPAGPVDWWQSIAVSPVDPQLIYASGYVYVSVDGSAAKQRQPVFYRTDNGGASWTSLPIDPSTVTVMANSTIDIIGIAPDGHVYIRVELDDNVMSDSLYRSDDLGASWHKINHKATAITAFVVRAAKNSLGHHDLIDGTVSAAGEISHDDGATWTTLASSPFMNCLVENAAGELWACTQNYVVMGIGDDAGIMKTTDPEAGPWTAVMRYQDLKDAESCAAGTPQQTRCVPSWCAVCLQLGCTPAASYNCPVAAEAPPDTPTMATPRASGGCCDTSAPSAGALALGLMVGMVMWRPRRRRGS